jgi:hypothetical protein
MTAPVSLDAVTRFLLREGWEPYKSSDRFQKMTGPSSIGDFINLTLPVSDKTVYDKELLDKVVDLIAEIYEQPKSELLAALADNSAVFISQLIDESTKQGAIPFIRFEQHIQEVKNLLLNNASFSVSKKHYVTDIPEEANSYLHMCSFLQTAVGSFVSKVQLPSTVDLSTNLFEEYSVRSNSINDNLGNVLGFVVNGIYNGSQSEIYSVEHVTNNASRININVFENINNLFKKTQVKEINFSLIGPSSQIKIKSGPVGSEEFKRLDDYIELASVVFSKNIEIDSRGRIIQLRSSNVKGSANQIVINRLQKGLKPIYVNLEGSQYDSAIVAHKNRGDVYIKGTAIETKNYLRIIRLVEFRVS